jgi:hypothetical protein
MVGGREAFQLKRAHATTDGHTRGQQGTRYTQARETASANGNTTPAIESGSDEHTKHSALRENLTTRNNETDLRQTCGRSMRAIGCAATLYTRQNASNAWIVEDETRTRESG